MTCKCGQRSKRAASAVWPRKPSIHCTMGKKCLPGGWCIAKTSGRPTSVSPATERQIRKLRAENPKLGIIKIAKQVGCGVSTVQRVLAV